MNSKKIRRVTFAALFAALTCAATMLIRIPAFGRGYVNLGDCLVNISGWLLGGLCGAAAAGIGSALADILSGFIIYSPATLIIKALMAFSACKLYSVISQRRISLAARIAAAASAELIMIVGYGVFEAVFYGSVTAALLGAAANAAQAVMGAASSVIVYESLAKKIHRTGVGKELL